MSAQLYMGVPPIRGCVCLPVFFGKGCWASVSVEILLTPTLNKDARTVTFDSCRILVVGFFGLPNFFFMLSTQLR